MEQADKYEVAKTEIAALSHENKGRYGYRRITTALHNRGIHLNHKTVQRLMKQLGLLCRVRSKKYRSYKGPHFFVPHENKDKSLSEYLPNRSKKNLDYKDRLFYYSHAMAVEGGEKSRKYISDGLASELNTTVAAFLFSDAGKIGDIGKKYTWIDFDCDLDSLLLAISDPESRIRTSDACSILPVSSNI